MDMVGNRGVGWRQQEREKMMRGGGAQQSPSHLRNRWGSLQCRVIAAVTVIVAAAAAIVVVVITAVAFATTVPSAATLS